MPSKPYFPVALDLVGERAVVVGGNDEALDKAAKLVRAEADVRVLWPEVVDGLRGLAEQGRVRWEARRPGEGDLRGARVVVLAEPDPALARELHAQGRREGFWLCAIDQPDHCDWVNVGQVEAGPVRVAIASGGGAPGLVKRLREGLAAALDARFAAFARRLVAHRDRLTSLPSAERRRRLALALEGFGLEITVRYPDWEAVPDGEPPG
ncbi:MAG: precorrin-2 dehydrogenase/sirohydrochlorin ferrochelatase family protein [Myxococcota bacterium]